MNKFNKTLKNIFNQKGSTLLFVAMMVSFLMVMALSVAQIIIFEVKMGGDFASSQKAFYGKQGAFELSFLNKANISSGLVNGSQIYGTITNPNIGLYIFNSRGLSSTIRREEDRIFVKPKVATAHLRSYALTTSGSLFVAGNCDYGEFGIGEDRCYSVWTDPAMWYFSLSGVVDIAAGFKHSVALKSDGTVWGTGLNWDGQLGLGDNQFRYEWTKSNISDVVKISTNEMATYALKSDGTVWSTGDNTSGVLGTGDTANNSYIWRQARVSATEYLTDVVDIGGSQLSWSIAAVKSDGTLLTAGENYYGSLGLGYKDSEPHRYFTPVKNNIKKVHLNYYHTVALDKDGVAWGVGDNVSGQLGLGAASESLSWVILSNNIKDIETGSIHTFLLTTSGRLYAAGEGHVIGTGIGVDHNTFVDVGLNNVIDMAGGWGNSAVVTADGSYYATGDNYGGALGLWNKNKWDFTVWTKNPNFSL